MSERKTIADRNPPPVDYGGTEMVFIYVLERPGRCKIGMSKQVRRRLNDIVSASGLDDVGLIVAYPVVPALARKIEREAHHLERQNWIRGEWFSIDPGKAIDAVHAAILKVTREHAIVPRGQPACAIKLTGDELKERMAASYALHELKKEQRLCKKKGRPVVGPIVDQRPTIQVDRLVAPKPAIGFGRPRQIGLGRPRQQMAEARASGERALIARLEADR